MGSKMLIIEGFLVGVYASMILSSALIMLFFSLVYKIRFLEKANSQVILIYLLYAFACITFGLFNLFVMQSILPEVIIIFPHWIFEVAKYTAPISFLSFSWLFVISAPLKSLSAFIYWQKLRKAFYFLCLCTLILTIVLAFTSSIKACTIMNLMLFIPNCLVVIIFSKKEFYNRILNNFMGGVYVVATLCFFSLIYLMINSNVIDEVNIYIRFLPFLMFGLLMLFQSYTVVRFNHEEAHDLGNHSIVRMRHFFMQVYRGFKNDEFFMVYQPKITIHNNKVMGAEALIRWKNAEKGLIPPDEFISIAEHTKVIDSLCCWMIDTVTVEMKEMLKNDLNLCISINFSVRNLKPKMVDYLTKRLDENGISANNIIIEITESLTMDYNETQQLALKMIHDLGIRLSLDDYGSGFSSVERLHKLGVDEIKIDQSLLKDFEFVAKNQVIVYSTIQMGHALNIKVVAEGVKNLQQMNDLKNIGCDIAQGYAIAKPMKIQSFVEWITNNGVYSKNDL